jgi:hypothetical protein
MEFLPAKKEREFSPISDDFDDYDIHDCLAILRYLQTFTSQDLRTEELQRIIGKLENRIKCLVKITS